MRAAAKALAACESHLRTGHLSLAASAADGGMKSLPNTAPSSLRRTLLNAQGVALHLLGESETAHECLSAALVVATHAAAAGEGGHDSYEDIGGTLGDLAANHIKMGQHDEAEAALKRGIFMLKRAYRPSSTVRACLLNVRGCLHEAQGDDVAALAAHEEAHSLLLATDAAHAHERHAGWLQACRHGSAWTMLRTGSAAGAVTLSAADTSDERLAPLDARERAFARSRHAIAILQRMLEAEQPNIKLSEPRRIAAATLAAVDLNYAADELASCLGDGHAETVAARANHQAARRAISEGTSPTWTQHWQPALGAGLKPSPQIMWEPASTRENA